MKMTLNESIITVVVVMLGTWAARFLPFIVFPSGKKIPKYITYLGKVLAAAVFGLLIVYSLRNVNLLEGSHGLPELISIAVVVLLHLWKRNMLISISAGTLSYMVLIQFILK